MDIDAIRSSSGKNHKKEYLQGLSIKGERLIIFILCSSLFDAFLQKPYLI